MKFINSLFLFAIVATVNAQQPESRYNTAPLLFKTFVSGEINMKNGAKNKVKLNYNTNNQSIVFVANNQYYELDQLDSVTDIAINNKKFIPVSGKVYEQTDTKDILVSYTNNGGGTTHYSNEFGSGSKTANSKTNTVDNFIGTTTDIDEGKFAKNYWQINKEGKLANITDVRHIEKVFGISKKVIKEYIENQQLNLNRTADFIKLIIYLDNSKK